MEKSSQANIKLKAQALMMMKKKLPSLIKFF